MLNLFYFYTVAILSGAMSGQPFAETKLLRHDYAVWYDEEFTGFHLLPVDFINISIICIFLFSIL